jgi:endoglycosylceramidase
MVRRLAVLLFTAAALLGATVASTAQAAPVAPFDHAGRWLTDAEGRVLILHGVNMVYKRPPYTPAAAGFDDEDAAFLADEGYDTVRVGVIWKAVEPSPGVYDDAYLTAIKGTVDTLQRHGIVSVIDFHQDLYNERFQGEGAPDWAVLDDGLPAEPKLGFPGNYLAQPATQRAFDHFWDNDPGPGGVGLQDRFAAAWRHTAQFFRGNPGVLGHELFNEPWPGTTWALCGNAATGCPVFEGKLTTFVERVTKAIRTVDPDVLVMYEPQPLFNNGVKTVMGKIDDPHLVFAFHDYCLSATNSGSDAGCAPFDDLVFANAEQRSKDTGDALLMTEWGSIDAPDVLTNNVERADRNRVGWQYWSYCRCDAPTDTGGEGASIVLDPRKAPTGENIKASKLKILSRPHPRAVAGTPTAWTWDGTTFKVGWTVAAPDGSGARARAAGATPRTELAVPRRQFPDGYGARVDGGAIVSSPGASVLRVVACPGVSSVRVTVSAKDRTSTASCRIAVRRFALRLDIRHAPLVPGRRVLVTVRVRRKATGKAVPGATVRLGAHSVKTNGAGTARVRVLVGRRGLTLRVTAPGAVGRTVRLAAGSRRRP